MVLRASTHVIFIAISYTLALFSTRERKKPSKVKASFIMLSLPSYSYKLNIQNLFM